MTTPPLPSWTAHKSEARFSPADACAKRSGRFERTIKRRNAIEYLAGALVLGLFGTSAAAAAANGMWDFAVSALAVVVGTFFVLWTLHRDGSLIARRPEDSCLDHLRGQLGRQRDLLRRVPAWYLAPFVPGVLGIYAAMATRVASEAGWERAIEGAWKPFGATVAFFVFVALLNLWAARKLDGEIAQLDAIG